MAASMTLSRSWVLWLIIFSTSASAEEPIRWLAIGGGGEPASTQLSLEQDVLLARQTFGAGGIVLFAGGAENFGVQVTSEMEGDALERQLGEIFDPRLGRDARYRRPEISADGASTPEQVRKALERALDGSDQPLLLYVAAHGEQGDSERDNRIVLWGGFTLSAADLARWLDESNSPRRVVMVNSACYSGGFMEMVFADADPKQGAPKTLRCGLFATTEDQLASGCDPNPQRRDDEGYGRFVLRALRGEDAHGRPLPTEQIDLDRDGKISLLEAHSRARIATHSLDTPTTTSERWLRQFAPRGGSESPFAFPEEEATVTALSQALAAKNRSQAETLLRSRDDALSEQTTRLKELDEALHEASENVRIALLERWPVLDDPWHPEFRETIGRQRAAIEAFLATSPTATAYRRALDASENAAGRADELLVDLAVIKRLVRAHQTLELARKLKAVGGKRWKTYLDLLACERIVPR